MVFAGAIPAPGDALRAGRTCACFKARRAARAITRLYDEVLGGAGLSTPQFATLAVIHARGAVSMQALATALGLDPSTMTRTLQPLQKAGWVRIEPGDDRRVRRLVLTTSGRHKLAETYKLWDSAQRRLRAKIGGRRFDRLLADLDAVAVALHE